MLIVFFLTVNPNAKTAFGSFERTIQGCLERNMLKIAFQPFCFLTFDCFPPTADIKPDNVLEAAPASGRYKLADFGMCVPLIGEHSPQARGALVRYRAAAGSQSKSLPPDTGLEFFISAADFERSICRVSRTMRNTYVSLSIFIGSI
jgi:hypothetical protein